MLSYIIDEIIERNEFEIVKGHQPHHAIMILLDGSFFCKLSDEVSFVAKAGDIIVFPLDCLFERQVIEPCRIYLAYFSVDTSHPLGQCLPSGKLNFHDLERAKANKNTLIDLLNRSDEPSNAMRQHILNDILYQYFYECAPSLNSKNKISPEVFSIIDYMAHNLAKQISLDELADIAGLSKNGLIKRFRSEIGCTPYAYLSQLRLQKAKSLILHTSLSMSQIAEKCGYDSLYYFSNSFKKKFGVSPSSMRIIRPKA